MAKDNGNGTARWVRWCLGIVIGVLLAVAATSAATTSGMVENRTNITNMDKQLSRIEAKLDKALGIE